jgi:hypothetical protein
VNSPSRVTGIEEISNALSDGEQTTPRTIRQMRTKIVGLEKFIIPVCGF